MTALSVRRAGLDDLTTVAPLFDAYRVFYRLPSDPDASSDYIEDRLTNAESVIFLAVTTGEDGGEHAVGFTQLYPSFCSLELSRIFVLYDLFVMPDARGTGAGKALLTHAAQFGRDNGAARLELSTAVDNLRAQGVYESLGWKRDLEYLHYELPLS